MTIQRHHVGKRLSEMVVHQGTVYLAGQVAAHPTPDITAQATDVFSQIDRLLAEVGSNKSKLVSVTVYLTDMANFEAMNRVWDAWIPAGQPPARATVKASLVNADYLIEVQVIATL